MASTLKMGDDANMPDQQANAPAAQTSAQEIPSWLVEREERLAVVTLGPLLFLILVSYTARWCVRNKIFRRQ
jgi:hypothetical protein